jgi:hypothetical protein
MVILMDSDRVKSETPLNATKQRIEASWAGQPGFAWVTAGREIENYVEPESMLEALKKIAPKKDHRGAASPYDRSISVDANGKPGVDKLKVARWLVENKKLTLSRLDLETQIGRLCDFVLHSNHSLAARTVQPEA